MWNRPNRAARIARRAALALALLAPGCASRVVPTTYPATAAATASAPAAPSAHAARSLAQDPPLPGESTAGWPGLASDDARDAAPRASAARDDDDERAATDRAPRADASAGGHHAH